MAFPFDWNVSYNGVSKCIENKLIDFTELSNNNRINKYDIYFHHDFDNVSTFNNDKEKYIRRSERFIHILETTSDDIIFCRKSHAYHHHYEHDKKYYNIMNDVDDAEKLDIFLSNKYQQLKYKIILILACEKCFNLNTIYKSNSDRIEIYNMASSKIYNKKFELLCHKIFKV